MEDRSGQLPEIDLQITITVWGASATKQREITLVVRGADPETYQDIERALAEVKQIVGVMTSAVEAGVATEPV